MIGNVLTRASIAEAISSVDQLDDETRQAIRLKLNHLEKRGLLKSEHDPNATATSPKYYRKRELARAAILTDALFSGSETDGLSELAAALERKPEITDNPPSHDIGGSFAYTVSGLESAVKGVLANDPGRWLLNYSFGRSRETGSLSWIAHVTYVPDGVDNFDPTFLGDALRRQIRSGSFNLTARFQAFGWMLRD